MKKLVLLSCSFIASLWANAQTPTFSWVKKMGGTSKDAARCVALDASGNVYTTGLFAGTVDFDPGSGTTNLTSAGDSDIFISKLNPSGNFVWAKRMGSSYSDAGRSIAFDASGNVYTTGYFSGTVDFDPGTGTSNLSSAGTTDIYISKLNASGNFVWAKNMGGSSYDRGLAISIDANGNIYTTGYFSGTADFDPGSGTSNLTSAGDHDIFISKLDASGNWVWANAIGAGSADYGSALAFDVSGNVYATGEFQGTTDFNPGTGTSNLTSAGDRDIFVLKLAGSGNFVWAKNMGGTGFDRGLSIKVDVNGNIYTTGYFVETADFDPGSGTYNYTSAGYNDIFISKLDTSGNFVWAKKMGSTFPDGGASLVLDGANNVYTTGWFHGTVDFNPGTGTFNLSSAGVNDIFISKLNASGNFVSAINLGGTGEDIAWCLSLDAYGNIYAAGEFQGKADFNPASAKSFITSAGAEDIFVVKLSQTSGKMIESAGINEMLFSNNIKLYPNPSTGIINLESGISNEDIKIQILNTMGQIVMEENHIQDLQFNIKHLPAGLYYVKVWSNSQLISTKKIIKQ